MQNPNAASVVVITLMRSLVSAIALLAACATWAEDNNRKAIILEGKSEREIVAAHCRGEVEFVLPDRTRVDCLTDDIAWEFDRPAKWAEAIGQALHYAAMTGRTPGVVLICPDGCDMAILRVNHVSRRFDLGLILHVLAP